MPALFMDKNVLEGIAMAQSDLRITPAKSKSDLPFFFVFLFVLKKNAYPLIINKKNDYLAIEW